MAPEHAQRRRAVPERFRRPRSLTLRARRRRLCGELERVEDLVGLGEEGWKVAGREPGVDDEDDDGLSSHVQDDEAEDLSRLLYRDAIRKVMGVVGYCAEGDEEVSRSCDRAVELDAGKAGELDRRGGLVGRSASSASH